jgi:hypothetical protein
MLALSAPRRLRILKVARSYPNRAFDLLRVNNRLTTTYQVAVAARRRLRKRRQRYPRSNLVGPDDRTRIFVEDSRSERLLMTLSE